MMSEPDKIKTCAEYWRLQRESEKERNAGNIRVAESYESSLARIEEKLRRNDVDLNDYRE